MNIFQLTCLISASFILSSASIQDHLLGDLFIEWKKTYAKVYGSDVENNYRFEKFSQNYFNIMDFMSKESSVTLALNQFADLTSDEFVELYTGTLLSENEGSIFELKEKDLPKSVDWRQKGAVTPVKDQAKCGACWAFSAVGALEGLYFINNSQLASFSEQNLVDCVTADYGCHGGWPRDGFTYTAQSGGIESEDDYPYIADTRECSFDSGKAYDVNSGYYNVTPKNLTQMKAAIVQQPVSVGIQANQLVFQFYKSGVIKKFCTDLINHGVLVVGYDVIDEEEAFIVKNSWGASWGDNGYVYISTNDAPNSGSGVCGILMMPAIPYKD